MAPLGHEDPHPGATAAGSPRRAASVKLNPSDTVVEAETLVLRPLNQDARSLVILAASLLQVGKSQSFGPRFHYLVK